MTDEVQPRAIGRIARRIVRLNTRREQVQNEADDRGVRVLKGMIMVEKDTVSYYALDNEMPRSSLFQELR